MLTKLAHSQACTHTNPHFVKRDERPRGVQLSSIHLNIVELVHFKRKEINSEYLKQPLECHTVIIRFAVLPLCFSDQSVIFFKESFSIIGQCGQGKASVAELVSVEDFWE